MENANKHSLFRFHGLGPSSNFVGAHEFKLKLLNILSLIDSQSHTHAFANLPWSQKHSVEDLRWLSLHGRMRILNHQIEVQMLLPLRFSRDLGYPRI
jgi:hypothetical protein